MFGPITEVDRIVWQRQAAWALVELLNRAAKGGLSYADWQLGAGRLLIGRFLDSDIEARRAAFVAWAGFLRIDDWTAWSRSGVTHLHGATEELLPGVFAWRVRLKLTADLYDADGDGESR